VRDVFEARRMTTFPEEGAVNVTFRFVASKSAIVAEVTVSVVAVAGS
jgi:hypothetical protein